MIDFINQQEDTNCTVNWLQKNGTPLNVSAFSTKLYAVVKDGAGTIVVKFAKTASSGWLALDASNWVNGEVKFKVQSDITKTLKPGKYYVELCARFASAVNGDGYYDVVDEMELFQVKKSVVSTLTLP
jgi:hypothetical protein